MYISSTQKFVSWRNKAQSYRVDRKLCVDATQAHGAARFALTWSSIGATAEYQTTWVPRDPCADHWVGGVLPQNHAYQEATHFFFNMCNSISLMSSLGKLMPRCRSTRCFYVNCNVVREPSRPDDTLMWFSFFFLLPISRAVACSYLVE